MKKWQMNGIRSASSIVFKQTEIMSVVKNEGPSIY